MNAAQEIARRRTFAIISHPDAGKTTLTERLLRAGGAIQLAGNVRAKADRRRTRSDWMGIERDRGISVVTSVMTFEYGGCVFNLLDTPGHEDFSEDTYRTLTAVDSAVMVIDAAKGIEARTRKLFEICRLRDIPILTFINKMDREARDPFEIVDEVASTLALDTAPVTWPVGRAATFAGTYDVRGRDLHLTEELGQSDPRLIQLDEEMELVRAALPEFELQPFMEGTLTPVFFGSAIKEIGVSDLLDSLVAFGPPPRNQPADTRTVAATEEKLTALVFKIQANMDPNHRDRIAFARVCSGRLERGMRLRQVRTGKTDPAACAAILLRPRPPDRRGGVRRRRRRHPQPWHAADRRHADRGRGPELRRRAVFRAGDPAPGPAGRRDEGQEAAPGAAGTGRGRRGPALPAAGWQPADRRRGRHAAARRAAGAAGGRIRRRDRVRAGALRAGPLGDRRQGARSPRFMAENRTGMADDVDGDPVYLASSAFMMRRTTDLHPDLVFRDIKDVRAEAVAA